MAQKVTVELVDDLDGTASNDVSTVTFSLDGVSHEIDLTEANASALRDSLADFIAAARPTRGRIKRGRTPAMSGRPPANRDHTRAIREWARKNGYAPAQRGRLPADIIDAFEEAHAATSRPQGQARSGQDQQAGPFWLNGSVSTNVHTAWPAASNVDRARLP